MKMIQFILFFILFFTSVYSDTENIKSNIEVQNLTITSENVQTEKLNLAPEIIDFDTTTLNVIIIKWDKKSDEELIFNIYRKTEDVDFIKINSEPIKITQYVDSEILTGTVYVYKIEVIDKNGVSYFSKEFSIKSKEYFFPSVPISFKVYQDVETCILKWTGSNKGTYDIKGYNIYKSEDNENFVKIAFVDYKTTKYEDENVIPGKKYFYKITAVDSAGYESELSETQSVVPFPFPRTSLVLMPTALRNDIFFNWGINLDIFFTYFIGGIYGEHNIYPYGKDSDSFLKVGASILTGDIKLCGFNEDGDIPAVAIGYNYSLLMQDKFGVSSNVSGVQASFSGKEKDAFKTMKGFYLSLSKKVIFNFNLHTGYILGEQLNYMPYLSKYLTLQENEVNQGYFFGFNKKIFSKMGLRVEYIVPVDNKINKTFLLPSQYLINTYIDRFINFNISYFHFNGGYVWLGYLNFRFTIFPNPYK